MYLLIGWLLVWLLDLLRDWLVPVMPSKYFRITGSLGFVERLAEVFGWFARPVREGKTRQGCRSVTSVCTHVAGNVVHAYNPVNSDDLAQAPTGTAA